jgi:hypothetical protein
MDTSTSHVCYEIVSEAEHERFPTDRESQARPFLRTLGADQDEVVLHCTNPVCGARTAVGVGQARRLLAAGTGSLR